MTRPLKALAAFVATLALFYLLGAFVAWDWNAAHWGADTRGAMILAAAFAGILVALFIGYLEVLKP